MKSATLIVHTAEKKRFAVSEISHLGNPRSEGVAVRVLQVKWIFSQRKTARWLDPAGHEKGGDIDYLLDAFDHRRSFPLVVQRGANCSMPYSSLDSGTLSACEIIRSVSRRELDMPRSISPIAVLCSPQTSANRSWEKCRSVRSFRTRLPNSRRSNSLTFWLGKSLIAWPDAQHPYRIYYHTYSCPHSSPVDL
jgi:hypothetical protein